eukprot:2260920-Rhodomonas_salina.1
MCPYRYVPPMSERPAAHASVSMKTAMTRLVLGSRLDRTDRATTPDILQKNIDHASQSSRGRRTSQSNRRLYQREEDRHPEAAPR